MDHFTKSSPENNLQKNVYNKIKNAQNMLFPHRFSISDQKVTPKGLADGSGPPLAVLGEVL